MEGTCSKVTLGFLLFVLLLGCSNSTSQFQSGYLHLPDTVCFCHGDVICRLGNGFFSAHFRNYGSQEKLYSHLGLLEVVHDSAFVLHAEASELTGIGYIKREPVHEFLSGTKTWGLYRFNYTDSIKNRIVDTAKWYFDCKTPFDLQFDLSDDNALYCTEYIAVSINKGCGQTIISPTLLIQEQRFYGLDDIYLHPDCFGVYKYLFREKYGGNLF